MNRPVNRPANRGAATDGAHSLGERKKKGWLLWLILGLLILAALAIWAIVHNRNNDDDKSTTNTTVAAAATTLPAGNGAVVTTAAPTATVTGAVPATTASAATPNTATAATATTAAGAGGGATPTTVGVATTQAASTGAAATTTAAAGAGAGGSSTATIPPAPAPTTPLAANGQDLVAISSTTGALSGLTDQPATGQATVQAVVSDEGFWVGSNEQNRVFVFLSTEARGSSGESPFQVVAGQTVEIVGTLVSTDGRIPSDVTAADGLQQLTDQHVLINATSLKLVK